MTRRTDRAKAAERLAGQQVPSRRLPAGFSGTTLRPDVAASSTGFDPSVMTSGGVLSGNWIVGGTLYIPDSTGARLEMNNSSYWLQALKGDGSTSFSVDTSGNVTLVGSLSASSIDIPSAGTTGLHIDTSGNLGIGSTTATTGNFKVSAAGAVTVAGTGSAFTLGSGNNVVKMDGTNGLWVGNATFGSAPFRVTQAGAVTATSVTLTGGTAGGWTITSTTFSGGGMTLDSSSGTITAGTVRTASSGTRWEMNSGTSDTLSGYLNGITNPATIVVNGAVTALEIKAPGNTAGSRAVLTLGDTGYATLSGTLQIGGDFTLPDAGNIIVGTTSGTKIGTATTQKLAFFNATPVVQQSGSSDVLTSLVTLGLRASSSNPPLDLGSGALGSGTHTLTDAANIVVGTSTGTKIGTTTSQKIGIWNTTPVVQRTSGNSSLATYSAVGGAALGNSDTWGGYRIGHIVGALKDVGILA